MQTYRYTCRKCGEQGTIHTTDGMREKNPRCYKCWQEDLVEAAFCHIAEAWPQPLQMETLTARLKEEGFEWEEPLGMMCLHPRVLEQYLRRAGLKFSIETMLCTENGIPGYEVVGEELRKIEG